MFQQFCQWVTINLCLNVQSSPYNHPLDTVPAYKNEHGIAQDHRPVSMDYKMFSDYHELASIHRTS